MKRILIVLGEYINRTAQNGICIDDIKRCLEADGVEIDILCVEREKTALLNKQDNIYAVLSKKHVGRLSNMVRRCIKFLHMPVGSYKLTAIILKEIRRLCSLHSYDAVIAVVNPTESAEAVFRYKKKYKNIKFILYEIDPASNRYKKPKGLLQILWKKKSMQWEKKIYAVADKIIHMKTHANHFSLGAYKKFEDKVCYLDIPSFKIIDYKENINNQKENIISFIYAGTFYPVLREPYYMIKLLSQLSEKKDIRVDIFTGNNMIKHIKSIVSKNNDIFFLHDLIPQDRLNIYMEETDILLSVGNYDSDFLPSKTLYYIGTGKPIIHLYPDDSDVSNLYLKKYPHALLLDQREQVEMNVEKIISFIDNYKEVEISKNKLLEIYKENTPYYSAKKIKELLYD